MSLEIKISKQLIPYKYAFKVLQERAIDVQKGQKNELLWILEHPLTFTAGIKSKNKEILDKKIPLIKTNRGGKITLHSPGQKIIYFVINLNKRKKDVRKFVRVLENSIIEFLHSYKINSKNDKKNIGIWVKDKKIAAIGLRISKWIAYHGLSININNDLSQYYKILPCGLSNIRITSIYNENGKVIKNFEKKLLEILIKNINKI